MSEGQAGAVGAREDVERIKSEVVACTRLLVFARILDFSGHVSARVPGTDLLVIQPRDTSRAALSPRDLLVVDLDGEVKDGAAPPPVETVIHTGAYRARPDVNAVCHGHPSLSTVFSVVDRPLLPVRHFAYRFPQGLPVHQDATHIRSREQGDAVARTIGGGGGCLLRSHGTVVVGLSVQEVFMTCLDIEENARTLLYASGLGPVLPLSPGEVQAVSDSYSRSRHRPGKVWEHYIHLGRAAGVL
ncbi:MAG: class II aldolase/adducin family protein [Acidimicrobiales bacterium]